MKKIILSLSLLILILGCTPTISTRKDMFNVHFKRTEKIYKKVFCSPITPEYYGLSNFIDKREYRILPSNLQYCYEEIIN